MKSNIVNKEEQRESVILSAKNVIRIVLNMSDSIALNHKKKLLSEMLWVITEADGLVAKKRTNYKYKITYISSGTLDKIKTIGEDSPGYIKGLRHEHVFTRSSIINDLLRTPSRMKEILDNAIGCIVTLEEDRKLSDKGKGCNGWERYKSAGVKVYKRNRDLVGEDKFEIFTIE